MRNLFGAFERFITAMLGDLTPTGKMWARVGVVTLIVAAAMSFDFGYAVSLKHACYLALLSFAAAFGPEVAHKLYEEGRYGFCAFVALCASGLLVIEFGSHQSYTAGIRGSNLGEARTQNVRYDGAQERVEEAKTSLKFWTERLTALEAQNAWVTTVNAEALRSQLASAELAIKQEEARGGCKAKCLARTKERDELLSKIALAEEKGTLVKQIEGARKVIAGARDTADKTERKESAVQHANDSLARLVAFFGQGSTKPSEHIMHGAEMSANLAMALAGTGLPAFCLLVAGLYRKPRRHDDDTTIPTPAPMSLPAFPETPQPTRTISTRDPQPQVIHTREVIPSAALRRWSVRDEVRSLLRAV